MHTRVASIVLLGLGIADIGVLDLLLAPRLARMEAAPAAPLVREEAADLATRLTAEPARETAPEAPATRAGSASTGAGASPCVRAAPDVMFSSDSALVRGRSAARALGRVIADLGHDPARELLLRGHSDPAGLPAYNLALAQRRAGAVKEYLVRNGAPGDRIAIEAVGADEPLDPRPMRSAWARDRRVELLWR